MFGPGRNGMSSGSRASRPHRTQGHHPGCACHQNRGRATVRVSYGSRQPAHHMHNDPMHTLATAMADLDSMLGAGRQGHGGGTRSSRGSGFPFTSDSDSDEGLDSIMEISRLHMGSFDEAFSNPIFGGSHGANERGAFSHFIFAEPRAAHPSEGFFIDPFTFERSSSSRVHDRDLRRGERLPFHTHPAPPQGHDYFPIELEPPPLPEDVRPTQTGAHRVERFIALHTEPLTAANTTVTKTTDCPICMENASAHSCVKIKGIVGCEHMIGRNCLKELLKRRPDDEKTCPLCRAVWLAENGVWQDSEQWTRRTGRADQGSPFRWW